MGWEIDFLQKLNEMGAQNASLNWLSQILRVITFSADSGLCWIILAIILVLIKRTRKLGLYLTVGLIFSVVINNMIIKHLVNRARPFEVSELLKQDVLAWLPEKGFLGLFCIPDDASFTSGHTFTSFTAATVIFYFHKKTGIFTFLIAALIGFSRLYFGVHFPTDVICGAVFGIITGIVAIMFAIKIENPFLKLVDLFKVKVLKK